MNELLIILALSIPLLCFAWLLPEKWQLTPLTIATAIFLLFASPISLITLLVTTLTSYYVLKHFKGSSPSVILVVIQICSIFIFFKVQETSFFNLTNNSLLPLGLSYYSFRQIHYVIEGYKKELPKHTLIDYLNYLFFLPTILIGPINRFQPFLKDYKKRRWDATLFSTGLERILFGLAKVIVLGNYLLSYELHNYTLLIANEHEWLSSYLQMFKFAANAYVQFAGFSDVAIGLSALFGFRINENFNYPFLAKNIADFWRRWHMSLSEWCKDYVFLPFLGITRNGLISIIISMFTLGLWHEISLRYILWGVLHAIAINIFHRYEKTTFSKRLTQFPFLKNTIGILLTSHFVMLSFVLISEESLGESIDYFKTLFLIKN